MSDRYDRNDNGGVGFVMGVLTGAVIGAGLGLLFAPKAGSELREELSAQANDLANQASKGYKRATKTAGEWADSGREMYGQARDVVTRGADQARDAVSRGADQARDAVARGTDEAERYVRDAASTASAKANDLAGSATAIANNAAKDGATALRRS